MEFFNFNPGFLVFFVVIVVFLTIWDLVWRGLALWKAARNNHGAWFVCIFMFKTAGILPIIYILLNGKKNEDVVN